MNLSDAASLITVPGLQHTQTTLSARLLEPRAIRGPLRSANGQNCRLILSSPRGALQLRTGLCGRPWRMKRMLSWEVAGTEVDRRHGVLNPRMSWTGGTSSILDCANDLRGLEHAL